MCDVMQCGAMRIMRLASFGQGVRPFAGFNVERPKTVEMCRCLDGIHGIHGIRLNSTEHAALYLFSSGSSELVHILQKFRTILEWSWSQYLGNSFKVCVPSFPERIFHPISLKALPAPVAHPRPSKTGTRLLSETQYTLLYPLSALPRT